MTIDIKQYREVITPFPALYYDGGKKEGLEVAAYLRKHWNVAAFYREEVIARMNILTEEVYPSVPEAVGIYLRRDDRRNADGRNDVVWIPPKHFILLAPSRDLREGEIISKARFDAWFQAD